MKYATFDTYPPMFIDYGEFIENDRYDDTLRWFVVPKLWAVDFISRFFGMKFEEFMRNYTWDDTFQMYECAMQDNQIVSDYIMDR